MGRFSEATEVINHAAWGDETVTLRRLKYGDNLAIQKAAIVGKITAQNAQNLPIDMQKFSIERLKRAIVSWTFTLDDGTVAPIDEAHIALLSADDVAFIEEHIERMNPVRGDDFQG